MSDFEIDLNKEKYSKEKNKEKLKEKNDKMKSPCLGIARKLLQHKTTCIIVLSSRDFYLHSPPRFYMALHDNVFLKEITPF